MRKQLRWLHLSDIHFRSKLKLDQNDAFARIRADLTQRKAEGRCPDLIFVSGDLVFSGVAADYNDISDRLDELCSVCGLSRDRVFFCPGNHDSDITVAPVLLEGCWSSFKDIAAFQAFLGTPEFQSLKGRQAAYRSFVQAFRGSSAGFDSHELHSEASLEVGDITVGVFSINSSLLAQGGADDRGRLQVCFRTLEEPCERLRTHDLRFVLIHHPFEWLAPFESDRTEGLVFDSGDIILRGHVHQRKLVGSLRGGLASTAGAVWDATAGDYEYSFGSVECDTLTCTIESVRYMQQTGDWMANSKTALIFRDRDERCTPRMIRDELRMLTHPAQIAAVLSGFSSELMVQSPAGPNYLSTERILAEHLKSKSEEPALGIIRVGTLLMFYGHDKLEEVLQSEVDVVRAYDRALQAESRTNPDFANVVASREQMAERLMRTSGDSSDTWNEKLLRRLVSEGDISGILQLRDEAPGSVLSALKAVLPDVTRDTYEAWLRIGGGELEYVELANVATRLASTGTADLAATALADAAARFPVDARRLDNVARVIAIELGDQNIYKAFRKAVEAV